MADKKAASVAVSAFAFLAELASSNVPTTISPSAQLEQSQSNVNNSREISTADIRSDNESTSSSD